MSNHNSYWGQKFGFVWKDGTRAFRVRQLSSGVSRSGPHQVAPASNSPRAIQAKKDREAFIQTGMPVVIHKFNLGTSG